MKIGPIFLQHSTQMSFELPKSCRIKTTPHFASQLHEQAACDKGKACFQWVGGKISGVFSFVKRVFTTIFFYLTCGFCCRGYNIKIETEIDPLAVDTFVIIPKIDEEKIPDLNIQYQKVGKNLLITEIEFVEGNKKYLSQTLQKTLEKESATGFIANNLVHCRLLKNLGFKTDSSVLYDPDRESTFEKFIDQILEKGEKAYPLVKQKEAFNSIKGKIPVKKEKSLIDSFILILNPSSHIILPLSDILELIKDVPAEDLKKIPLNGMEVQKGGLFFLSK